MSWFWLGAVEPELELWPLDAALDVGASGVIVVMLIYLLAPRSRHCLWNGMRKALRSPFPGSAMGYRSPQPWAWVAVAGRAAAGRRSVPAGARNPARPTRAPLRRSAGAQPCPPDARSRRGIHSAPIWWRALADLRASLRPARCWECAPRCACRPRAPKPALPPAGLPGPPTPA